ncbi:MAG: tyrosine-type recombinase/integrase [Bacteroidota bacterium]|nr:tyrosine-type recombinase/integrase [Bacteroidota bacterium]
MYLHFYLNKRKNLSKKLSIFCYIRGVGGTIVINTKERINPENWNLVKERAIESGKGIYVGAPELNAFLNAFEEKVKKNIRNFLVANPDVGFYKIKDYLLKQMAGNKEIDFFNVWDEYLDVKKNEVSKETLGKYRRIKHHIEDFSKKHNYYVSFDSVNLKFRDLFFAYLLNERNMVNSTAYKTIETVKGFMLWSLLRKYHKSLDFKEWKSKQDEFEVIRFNEPELEKLKNFVFKQERLERTRDLFIFQCNCGVRYSDLSAIKREDIIETTWYKRLKKTHNPVEIPLSPDALMILDKYKDYIRPLPIISNPKYNEYIKEVCKTAGINNLITITRYRGAIAESFQYPKYELITTHTARRTFISLSLAKGMPSALIMKITGHKDERSFWKYAGLDYREVNTAFHEAWGSPLHLVNTDKK